MAEGGLGSQGIFIGQDLYSGASFVYDPWVLYQRGIITAPNIVLAGIVGSGKSSLAKCLYTRSLPFGRRVYVPGDPKGEHTKVAEAVGGKAIALGHGAAARLNPLDEGYRPRAMSDTAWATTVAARRRDLIGALAEIVLARALTPLEHTAVDSALTATVRENSVPILPMISLDLSRVTEKSTLISVLMTCSSAWMEAALLAPAGGQRWVVYDEAWRLMQYPALLKRLDSQWRLARHYGIANMLIVHKLSDLENVGDSGSAMRSLANSLLANAETRIIYRQESDQLGITAETLGLTRTERQLLPQLTTGQGL